MRHSSVSPGTIRGSGASGHWCHGGIIHYNIFFKYRGKLFSVLLNIHLFPNISKVEISVLENPNSPNVHRSSTYLSKLIFASFVVISTEPNYMSNSPSQKKKKPSFSELYLYVSPFSSVYMVSSFSNIIHIMCSILKFKLLFIINHFIYILTSVIYIH